MKKFLRRFKKNKMYIIEPMVYLYKNDSVCNRGITSRIKWLDDEKIKARDEDEADEIAFKLFKVKYPNWTVWIYNTSKIR